MAAEPLADVAATVTTYTVDRLAYTPSPPVLMVVLDFDGGGRMRGQLTDAAEDEVGIGLRVEMTFRRRRHRGRRAQLLLESGPIRSAGRAECLRVPDRRVRAADDVRSQAAAARRSHRKRRAGRTVADGRSLALTHNLGGGPGEVRVVRVRGGHRAGA